MADASARPGGLFFYSPWQIEPEELRTTFVGRHAQLKRLKREIAGQSGTATLQHVLLVGPRGIGKSHLMALLYHAAREEAPLRAAYVPVALAEEEYGLGNLRDLAEQILERLQTTLAEEGTKAAGPGRRLVEQAIEGLAVEKDDAAAAERGLAALADLAARLNRRILLFTENLDMVLGEQFSDDWGVRRLRDFLMNETALLWVASAPTLFAEVDDAEQPLFKLFRVERVEELSRDDLLNLLLERARYDAPAHPAAKRLAEGSRRDRARLQAVLHLTGGSPRLALMLYQVALRGDVHEAQQALGGLLDQLSPYFQERMRGLSPQRRKIVQTLADSDGVLTPTQISQRSRVGEPKQAVAQLRKLLDLGWVTRPRQSRSKQTYYTLREVLFRYWRQWRTSPSRRARMAVFIEFLTLFYGAEELDEALESGRQALADVQAGGEARFIAAAGATVAYLEAAKERVRQRTAEEKRRHREIGAAAEAWKQGDREPALRLFAENPVFQLALKVEQGARAIEPALAQVEEPLDLEPTADAALDAVDDFIRGIESEYVQFGFHCDLARINHAAAYTHPDVSRDVQERTAWTLLGCVPRNSAATAGERAAAGKRLLEWLGSDAEDDERARVHRHLANDLRNLGLLAEAHTHATQAVEFARAGAGDESETAEPLAAALNNLGTVQSALGEWEAARDSFSEALTLYRRLSEAHPAAFEQDVALVLNNLGNVQSALGEWEAARDSFSEALTLYRRLSEAHPAAFEQYVAHVLNNLGTVQSALGEREAARDSFSEALTLYRRLSEAHPAAFEQNVALVLNNLGTVQSALGEWEAARESYAEALEIRRRLALALPLAFLDNLAQTTQNFCRLLWGEGDAVAAVAAAGDVWRIAWKADDPRALSLASERLALLGENVARREAETGNLGNASEHVAHLARLRTALEDPEPVNQSLLGLFRWALRAGHAETVLGWLEIVKQHPRIGEEALFHPVDVAARVATTGDRKPLDSLAPEVRQVVEALLRLPKGEPS